MADSVYLETTALIDGILKGWYPELSDIIEKANGVSTSQYSKMEIKKGFLHKWVLLYNKAVRCKSFEDISLFISNLTSSPNRYYLGACVDAVSIFEADYSKKKPSELKGQYADINEGEIRLNAFKSNLRTQIKLCFHKISTRVRETHNPMQCFKDLGAPFLEKKMFINKPLKCDESRDKCNITQYIRDNKDAFEKILKKLETIKEKDKETTKRIRSLKEILKLINNDRPISNHHQNQGLCWDCTDAIHAVIPPHDSTLLTRNIRHFEPICEAIGRNFKGYSSPKIAP
ncbi:hypothetical protein [Candidatus Magnetobacterium casense]|uniref:hypothetical protein n=1 Tax=Candidatus Magnetobacterium casense TaxID=1455061 RepID=UPI00058CA707|nr:hypothetical protein [Candidatus Magnetobacterium casensis]